MAVKRSFDIHSSDSGASSPAGESSMPPSSPPELPLFSLDERIDAPEEELAEFEELDLNDRLLDDDGDEEEDDMGEDLFGDDMEADYRARRDLDQYDLASDQIDDQEYEAMDLGERRRVDALLNKRDQIVSETAASGRSRRAFVADLDDVPSQIGGAGALPLETRRRNKYDDAAEEFDEDEDIGEQPLSLEALADVKAETVAEWITQPGVHQAIAREYKRFLKEFTDDKGISVYGHRGQAVASGNLESFQLDYPDLVSERAVLAYFLAVAPEEVLKILDVATMDAITMMFSDYKSIQPEIHVRVAGLPTSFTLRELREHHLNTLVRVTGVVTRRTGVFPQLKYVKFDCIKCGEVLGPYVQDSQSEVRISFCHNCQSRGPFQVNSEKTLYRNYQRITVQESPGTVPAGRLPRQRDAILLWDLIDRVKPGDEVDLTGIYKNAYDGVLNVKNGFPVFSTVIEANNIIRRNAGHTGDIQCTAQEAEDMQRRSRDPKIIDKIIDSIAPSIYGHRNIKRAIACSLFGGVAKETGKIRLRGDINVLLLGDPGTAKSQILKYAEQTASRAVFATGQGASAVGLTASVRKDPVTREWTLEGGALVLADKGTCLIDEFDKMNDQDRTSIHEAMEQQSISISKAGIVTSLQARCAIIAAANPREGRYNASQTLVANVDLTEPILSRFDVLCVVQDIPNPENDERLARFVVSSHAKSAGRLDAESDRLGANGEPGPDGDDEDDLAMIQAGEAPFSQEYLRKYIYYARHRVRPQLLDVDQNRISALYSQLREESLKTGAFPITVRHLESIIRLSESFARMRLADFVSSSDVDRAIQVAVESFVQAQKMIHRRALRQSFTRFTYNAPS